MKIKMEEDGLFDALYQTSNYLADALNTKDRKEKDKFISKAYGAVVAINQVVRTEDDEINNETDENAN